jgi:uncharacterized membrane protein YczE
VTAPRPELHVVTWPSVAELARRGPRLLIGIVVLALGIACTLDARLGVSPYDVLHQGLADLTGLSFGTVVVLLGLVILVAWIPLGQPFGLGTIVNALSVGPLVDLWLDVLPHADGLGWRWALLVGGIVAAALGVGFYIGAGLGPGPRDGLMTGIAAKGFELWIVRTALELAALGTGWALGGDVGVGTVLFALAIGPLGHFFLARLHLGYGDVDPDPDAAVGE